VRSNSKRPAGARLWKKLLLSFAAVAIGLAAMELICRATGEFPPDPITWPGEFENRRSDVLVADPVLGWRLRADARSTWKTEGTDVPFATGPDGFRCDESGAAPHDPTRPQVAFVGDSFTFGIGVAAVETFAQQCSRRLGVRGRNLGVPGFAIDQAVLALEHDALPPKPALVVLTFILDDLQRSMQSFRANAGFNKAAFQLVDGELSEKRAGDRPGALLAFLDRHSHFHAALCGAMRRLGRRFGVGEWWRLNAALFRRAAGDCARAGVPLLIVHLPQRGRLDPFPALARLCDELRVPFLDLACVWSDSPRDAYFPDDGHLNAIGHARVGVELAKEIARRWPELAR